MIINDFHDLNFVTFTFVCLFVAFLSFVIFYENLIFY